MTVHLKAGVKLLNAFFFHHSHDVVHQGVGEFEAIHFVNGFFDDGGVVEGIACRGLVGVDQPADTQFDPSEIAYHDDTDVGDILGEDLVEDGLACRARWLAVVGRAETALVRADHVGVTMVAGVVILLLYLCQCAFDVVFGGHGEGRGDEFAAFLLVKPFAGGGKHFIGVVKHHHSFTVIRRTAMMAMARPR